MRCPHATTEPEHRTSTNKIGGKKSAAVLTGSLRLSDLGGKIPLHAVVDGLEGLALDEVLVLRADRTLQRDEELHQALTDLVNALYLHSLK